MKSHENIVLATSRALTACELWYGRSEPPPQRTALRAGPLTAFLEGADLRDLRFGGVELVRRLYFALRDENWDTIPAELKNLSISVDANSFLVSFDGQHQNCDLDFRWHATIQGDQNGNITYTASGHAIRGFRYCRIGFCVLHPPDYAGRPYRGTAPAGLITGELPQTICPLLYQDGFYIPLFDAISSLTVSLAGSVEVRFDFVGDLFEMEDQRNWTDGSFKTYCPPLSLGFPHTANCGQKFEQQVSITASGPACASDDFCEIVNLSLGPPLGMRLPQLGIGIATHDVELSPTDTELLARLHLDHLRADLHLNNPDFFARLRRAEQECSSLRCGLELALFLTDDAQHELLGLESLFPFSVPVSRVLVFHRQESTTSQQWVQQVRDRLAPHLPGVAIGGGTNLYFAELNQSRPNTDGLDAVAYPINPQVHSSDERSLVENIEVQRDTVSCARSFCRGLPIVVSPVTLKPRFNPYAAGPEPAPRPGELPRAVDTRQMSLFAAAWTVGSIKQLAEAGAASVTYYETTGWQGLKETDRGSPNPETFLSSPGLVFPVYHVFADIANLKTAELIACSSTDPLRLQGLALSDRENIHLLIANLTPETQSCAIKGVSGDGAQVRSLDANTVSHATAQPLQFHSQFSSVPLSNSTLTLPLAPYSVTRIDLPATHDFAQRKEK
jgi:hypothetical protein